MVMERFNALLILGIAVVLAACSEPPARTEEAAPVVESPAPAAAPSDVNDNVVPRSAKGRAPRIDRTTPEGLLISVKDIIATDALDSLRRFCHPEASSGSPAKLMCAISSEDMDQIDKFRTWFASAQLNSAVTLNGDTARLPITLAPNDPMYERHATLILLRRDGLYYLNNLEWQK